MENNQIEIFGRDAHVQDALKRIRHGLYITVNMKHRNAYMSRDLANALFGKNSATGGLINIVHSKIENNWYVASVTGSLFNGGFQCVPNDSSKESVLRVKGVMDVFRQAIESITGSKIEEKRYTISVSPSSIEYDGMKLHLITLQQ